MFKVTNNAQGKRFINAKVDGAQRTVTLAPREAKFLDIDPKHPRLASRIEAGELTVEKATKAAEKAEAKGDGHAPAGGDNGGQGEKKTLDEMTKDELLAFAETNQLEVDKSAKVDDLRAEVKTKLAQK